jgi:hypothetical protein
MYVHMHWSYKHPYAARTWRQEDWRSYLQGLKSLGYDFLMIWPMLDSMPPEPNESDRAFLEKLGRVISMAQDDLRMRVGIVVCPNTIGNERSSTYAFEQRPYFASERKVNPKDEAAVEGLLSGRRNQFRSICHADALVMIDSDPGGHIGSTNAEFVSLMEGQLKMFREMNPHAQMMYWMHFGWETYNRFWAEAAQWKPGDPPAKIRWDAKIFHETLSLMRERIPEPWGVFSWAPQHLEATDALGLRAKRACFPYGVIEGEPTFPLTNCDPAHIAERMKLYSPTAFPRGFMANAQTHALQLPHTYLVAHHVLQGLAVRGDLALFADKVLPGCGGKVARAWQAINGGDAKTQRACAQEIRAEVDRLHPSGVSSGLLLRDAGRFLTDLAMNLDVRAGLAEIKAALDSGADVRAALKNLLKDLRPYQERLGFVDAYGGPLYAGLNNQVARLRDPKIAAVLEQFHDWRNPEIRHGILPRLLNAVEQFCRVQ